MDRRTALKTIGVAGVATLLAGKGQAQEIEEDSEFVGMLVDTTRCLGCRSCELACAVANGFPEPDLDDAVLERERTPTEKQWSVVNRYATERGEVYVKKQCMHCAQPACASACLTKAMLKTQRGPVIWREDKCMGCRFCMLSCPFDIPKFEYDRPIPKIQKCNLCWARLQDGEQPACAAECPGEAILFGKRRELLDVARGRIHQNPDDYVHEIYGEHEVGGTGYLYLASVPFQELGFPTNLGTKPYPEFTKEFLYGVPIVLALWPPFLLALSNAQKATQKEPSSGT